MRPFAQGSRLVKHPVEDKSVTLDPVSHSCRTLAIRRLGFGDDHCDSRSRALEQIAIDRLEAHRIEFELKING